MNLLKDKREQERRVDSPDLPEYPNFDLEPSVELQSPAAVKKSRGPLLPLFVAFIAIGAAAIAYYWLIYQPSSPVTKPPQVEQVTPPAQASPTPSEQAVEVAEPQTSVVDVEAKSAESTEAETSIGAAARLLTALLGVVKSDDRIGSIFFDEVAFSAEITSTSVESAQSVYTAFGEAAQNVTVTSEAPTGSAMLLTGSFSPATVSEIAAGADLEGQVRTLAQQSGLTLTAMSVSGSPRLMYVKMNGPLSSGRDFLVLFARQNIRVKISKIIIMPAPANDYILVLRLLV